MGYLGRTVFGLLSYHLHTGYCWWYMTWYVDYFDIRTMSSSMPSYPWLADPMTSPVPDWQTQSLPMLSYPWLTDLKSSPALLPLISRLDVFPCSPTPDWQTWYSHMFSYPWLANLKSSPAYTYSIGRLGLLLPSYPIGRLYVFSFKKCILLAGRFFPKWHPIVITFTTQQILPGIIQKIGRDIEI